MKEDYLKVYGFEMARIAEVYLSTLSAIMTPHGLERFFVPMLYLSENGGHITQKDLSVAIRRDKVYTMRIVDYLSERGMIERKKDDNDRRCQILAVTSKGNALIPKIIEGIEQTDELLFHDFSKEEKEFFKTGMSKLFATISTLPDPKYIVKAHKIKNK